MSFLTLEEAIEPVKKMVNDCEFPTLIKELREAIGLKQYRAAEFIGVTHNRLKNLESGHFREMPTLQELSALSRLYDINQNTLETKAENFCEQRSIRRRNRGKYFDPML